MLDQAEKLSDWLMTLEGIEFAMPVNVKIGKSTYQAAYYIQKRTDYRIRCLYVLGELPKSFKHSSHVAYIPNDEFSSYEWYIAGYYQDDKPEFADFHPFGIHFDLHPWTLREAIDQYENNPYRRMNIEIL